MTVEQRLETAQRRCRHLSALLLICLSAVSLALFTGAKAADEPRELRVTNVEIVDEHGNVRVHIGRLEENIFGARFLNAKGELRAMILDEAQLSLINERGNASLNAHPSGGTFQLAGPGNRPRAMIYAVDDHAGIQLRDTNSKVTSITETPRIVGNADRIADPFAGK